MDVMGRLRANRPVFGVVVAVAVLIVFGVLVLVAQWLRSLPDVQDFMTTYPGQSDLPEGAPVGLPAWLGWQHFLSAFLLLLIVRTGWQVRTQKRPPMLWSARGSSKRIPLTLWLHLALDVLWIANGLVFIVLIFVSGHWVRIVPTSWDVVPNAVSVALQYASLHWPTENEWVNYNALQLLAYFVIVFIAAPLAILTGVRMSPVWPTSPALARIYPVGIARAVHFPVMLAFVLFTVAHVTLVLATGALRNLNHMYAGRDDTSWAGFIIFAVSLVVMAAAVALARPLFIRPVASLVGDVSRGR
jgi:thiosulfate reductase cytochrome b subunit